MIKKHLKLTTGNSGFKEINIFCERHQILPGFSVKRHFLHTQCVVNPQSELPVPMNLGVMLFFYVVS